MNQLQIPIDSIVASRRVMRESSEKNLWFAPNLNRLPGVDPEEHEKIKTQGKFAVDIITKEEYARLKIASATAARYSIMSLIEQTDRTRKPADVKFLHEVKLGEPVFIDDTETGITTFGIEVSPALVDQLEESKDFYVATFEDIAALDPKFPDNFKWDEIDGIVKLASFDTTAVSNGTRDKIYDFTQEMQPQTLDFYDVKLRQTVVDVPSSVFLET